MTKKSKVSVTKSAQNIETEDCKNSDAKNLCKKSDSQEKKAEKLRALIPTLLENVDNADVFRDHGPRRFSVFDSNEIQAGDLLGVGGFGAVYQARHVCPSGSSSSTAAERESQGGQDGDALYAIKRLKPLKYLEPVDQVQGVIDLAIEAKYLQVLHHPHIIKLHGVSTDVCTSPNFSLLLDRLYGTLEDKINEWRLRKNRSKRFHGILHDKEAVRDLLHERIVVAHGVASALQYMHAKRLVHRDAKPRNIGFDSQGRVKIFDFGCCKSLQDHLKEKHGYGYNLTPRTGSCPYMSPEVAMKQPYDEKADVYSFALLLWEIMSLREAYKGWPKHKYYARVCLKKERPLEIRRKWPPFIRYLIPKAWHPSPLERPAMTQITALIQGAMPGINLSASSRARVLPLR